MTLQSTLSYLIPAGIICVARAAFPNGMPIIDLYDAPGLRPIKTNPEQETA